MILAHPHKVDALAIVYVDAVAQPPAERFTSFVVVVGIQGAQYTYKICCECRERGIFI